jgi:acyl transferase domain-containing protein/NAD(P)H-dependent flavin oxidoreductase YrpB (nitropropane dioxygenase family)/NAD(P)-dependent dehydrogenase (short-subunit alcohol dehydrogenase family)
MRVHGVRDINAFGFILANVPGWLDPGIAIAASRCGSLGLLNCEGISDPAEVHPILDRLRKHARGRFGLKLEVERQWTASFLETLDVLSTVVLVAGDAAEEQLAAAVKLAKACAGEVLVEVTSEDQASRVQLLAIDGLIAKGQEAGGAIGEETVFVLLQRLLQRFSLPVWAHGGIGLHSTAACYVAGAAGVVLDSQLLLLADSSMPPRARAVVERSEGDETVIVGRELGCQYRGWRRQRSPVFEALQVLERELCDRPAAEARPIWRDALRSSLDWRNSDSFLPLGQDGALAAPLAARFSSVSALVSGLRDSVVKHTAAAQKVSPLAPGSALARSHQTEFPILQGPMTRVSDTAAFAASVAEGGGLPFLALALLRGPQVRELLVETQKALGARPWGVGILGFVPAELRTEQMDVVREIRPPFAIIAGGRPDQAASIEKQGTVCYLHVPSPKLLEVFIRDGARRFIFEGLECGGHTGPRTSFVLWESMIDMVQRAIDGGVPAEQFHMVFAGGIHDARSAAMVAAMTGPLAEQGVGIGVLMGTAYLFTEEAVAGDAIVETFQNEAKRCSQTVILETGPGHATRCANTPFYSAFLTAKRKLVKEKKSHDEIRNELEQLNLGRLRVASKGIVRDEGKSSKAKYKRISVSEQLSQGMYMIGQLAALKDQVTNIRELHRSVAEGGEAWLQSARIQAEKAVDDLGPIAPCDIAIVGMSCALPKAPDVQTFWANMINKVDAITEVPADRFNIDLYYDADRKARDKIYSRWGGFINDVPFEPLRYGIPPTALGSIDPMQLLSLIIVDRALDDAGYRNREFPRHKTSVIFGTSGGLGDLGGHYAVRSALSEFLSEVPPGLLEQLPEWTEDSFAGLLPNVAAGRVANRFNLGGVNFTVDAACASSMAAVYIGARELTSRSSDVVIVGGVDTVQSPFCFLCFSKAQALSPRGRCRPFDESADGIAISEGITVLVMKRLEDAERDGDRIYAVIKGVCGSSDGRGRSMTAPRREGQKLVLQRAYRQAGFSPSTVGLMEAHGTGTVAGDTTEMGSLSEVLVEEGADEHSCAVGSVKSLVGHTKAAAGVTGLMRVALALYHKVLPPTLHVEKPNAKLTDPGSPLFVLSEAQPWLPRINAPRRAGASSFGFGGTNFHTVLEEYLGEFRSAEDRMSATWPAELLVWNAASPAALETSLASLYGKLESGARPELRDLAASLCRRAASGGPGAARLALVATSLEDLRAKITTVREALQAGSTRFDQPSVYLETGPAKPPSVAFLFPGQGSQSPDMLRDLALHFPEFRARMEAADLVVDGRLPRRLSTYVYPPTAFTPETKKEQMRAITDTSVAQPALAAVEIALARLLQRLGVQPSMTAGHSFGEYVALCAAGVFSEEALFKLADARGRAMKDANGAEPGSMIAAEAPANSVLAALGVMDRITIANYNSPRQTVLAGPVELLDSVVQKLKAAKIAAVKLPVACAFHSPLVEGARSRLASALGSETFLKPSVPVFSNTLGDRYPAEPGEIAAVLTDHVIRPVRFIDQVRAMFDQGARIFLEVGPKGVLTNLTRQILDGTDALAVQIDASGRHGVASLLQALAQLVVRGVPVDTAELFRGRSAGSLNIEQLKPSVTESSQWLVNGGRAYQVSRPAVPIRQVQVVRTVEVEKFVEVERVVEVEKIVEVPQLPQAPNYAAPYAPSQAGVAPAAAADALMAPFQQLMGQFLETQAAIMMAYLQASGGATQPAASVATATVAPSLPRVQAPSIPVAAPVMQTAPVAQTAAPQITLAAPAPAPPVPAPAPIAVVAAPTRDVLAEVVRIASERTGYPAEILDVNASIEADLGVDSIKRVEILSSYQQLCTSEEQAKLQGVMEKLIAAPSLREIASVIIAALGVSASPAAPAVSAAVPAIAPATATAVPTRDVLAEVVRIASERTGYPAEILDVNASIEADLGVDSIKRVEILSSYQQLCTSEEQAKLQGVMEKLIAAPSLREIANVIIAALGVSASPGAPAVSASTPAIAPATVAVVPTRDVLAEVVRIASERTGYPAEILDVNASIEADLGVDSIKRVEILSSYQQLCTAEEQAKLQAVMEKLIAAPSLREIANVIIAALAAAETVAPVAPVTRLTEVTRGTEVPRFTFAAADCPRRGSAKHYAGRVCIITDDETGIAAGIAETWTSAGETVVLVRHSLDGTLTTDQVVTGDLTDSAAVKELVYFVRARYGAIGALIHLLPLRIEARDPRSNLKEWRDHLQQDIKSFYGLLHATEKDLREIGPAGGGLIAVATGRAGVFGLQPEVSTPPTHQGVADFAKTVALEFPDARCKIIDLDLSDPAGVLKEKLLEELSSTDDTLQVGLPGDRRLTALIRSAELNGGPRLSIGSDWVFLITGGARGITAEIAGLLAERHHPTLVIAGATPLPQAPEPAETSGIADKDRLKPVLLQRLRASGASVRPADVEAAVQRLLKEREIRATLESLKRTGAVVEYHGVDVRDEAAFGALIDEVYARHGRLDVVIHGAGIIEDKLIRDKAPDSFDRVVHTKADSAYVLEKKLRPDTLQCLLLMSSITAAFGNRGQADYGAANGIMNGMAMRLAAAWPNRVVAVNWGPWDQPNMVTEHIRKQFTALGVEIIPLREGSEAAVREIEASESRDPVVILGGGPWGKNALPAGQTYLQALGDVR